MKKLLLICIFLAAAAGLAWLVWFKPAKAGEKEAAPATDVGVRVGQITRATLRSYVIAYGVVEPAPPGDRPAASARVAASVPGVVAAVKCAEGQRVDKGALLFQLDTRAADVAVEKARRLVEFSEKVFERQQRLMKVDATSQKLLQEAEQAVTAARNELAAAQAQQALLRVEAPLAGTVTRLNVKPGEAVDLTTPLGELVDLERLVVSANVPATELAALKAAQPVEVLADQATTPVAGTLAFISPQIDAKTGTAPVRIALPANSGLRPGQFVTLRIVSAEHKDCLAVPVESVVKDSAGATVIALVEKDMAVQKPVKAGLRDGDLAEIEAPGLQPGMPIVTAGAYGLPKETKIHLLESKTNEHSK
jgi:RND family efflux transporter MFP subunit